MEFFYDHELRTTKEQYEREYREATSKNDLETINRVKGVLEHIDKTAERKTIRLIKHMAFRLTNERPMEVKMSENGGFTLYRIIKYFENGEAIAKDIVNGKYDGKYKELFLILYKSSGLPNQLEIENENVVNKR